MTLFCQMMSACLLGIISVLERQYKGYFLLSQEELSVIESESSSARLHNIDAESVMGMYSAGKERAKHASSDFLASRMKAKKNDVVPWLDGMFKTKREKVVAWSIGRARRKRVAYKKKQEGLKNEMSIRLANKRQQKSEKQRKDIEKKVKTTDIADIKDAFPDLDGEMLSGLVNIMNGRIVGCKIWHTWYDKDSGAVSLWAGKIEKLKRKLYKIAYWDDNSETYEDDSTDYDIPQHSLAADFILKDVIFC